MFLLISSLVLFNLSWISKGKEDKVNRETGEYNTENEEPVTSPNQLLDARHCTSAWEQGRYFFLKRYADILILQLLPHLGSSLLEVWKVNFLSKGQRYTQFPIPPHPFPLSCCDHQRFAWCASAEVSTSLGTSRTLFVPWQQLQCMQPKKPRQNHRGQPESRPSSSETDSRAQASDGLPHQACPRTHQELEALQESPPEE